MRLINYIIFALVLMEMGSGTSMFPVLNEGDRFIMETAIDPQANDIIVFEFNNVLYAHRVMSAHYNNHTTGLFRTKGDNENMVDPPIILKENVKGVIIWILNQNSQCLM